MSAKSYNIQCYNLTSKMNLSPQNGYQTFIRNCDSVHSNSLKNTKKNDKKIIFYFPLILSCGFLSSSCVKFIKKKVQIKPNIALTKQVLFEHNEGLLTFFCCFFLFCKLLDQILAFLLQTFLASLLRSLVLHAASLSLVTVGRQKVCT